MHSKPKKRIQVILITAAVLMALLGSSPPAAAQDHAPELFGNSNTADVLNSGNGPHIKRTRYTSVDIDTLFDAAGKPRQADSLPAVTLNLFDNAQFTGEIRQVTSDKWGTTWHGNLKEQVNGYFFLTVVDDVFVAHVASPLGVYEVSFADDQLYKIVEVDQSKFIDHPEGFEPTFEPAADILLPPSGSMDSMNNLADSADRIDIMVIYTRDARIAEGSTNAMKARIKQAVDLTNTSYADSGITTRLRLVHVREFNYTESGNLATDVERLVNTSDGHMDNVHSLRNTYAADMVGLIVENGGANYCGRAATIMASASTAFQVTVRNCATSNYSLGHEFGHLQGARHDIYVDSETTPFAYGHGFVRLHATLPFNRWRTVMAYNTKCAEVGGYNCTRLNYWSNPDTLHLLLAMGNRTAKNFQVLNETAATVANFRTEKIANDFNSSFNLNLNGWTGVNGKWTAGYLLSHLRSSGQPDAFASIARNGTYGDLTYEALMKRTGSCTGCANHIAIRGKPKNLSSISSWQPSYIFQYTNSGEFSVFEILGNNNWNTLQGWTSHSAIVQGGWNRLKVVAVGTSLKFYINGTLVWSGTDASLKTGQVGIGFYRYSDPGTVLVNWAKLSTTATADINPFEAVKPGVELEGGSIYQSP